PLRAVFAAAGLSFDVAVDECERSSLLQVTENDTDVWVETPEVARIFARSKLSSAEHSLEIQRDLELVKLAQGEAHVSVTASLTASQLEARIEATANPEERASLIHVLESL